MVASTIVPVATFSPLAARLATVGFEQYAKTTRRAAFLAEMEHVVPWPSLCGLVEPFYPKPGNGRPPVGVERMLRIYFLQQWFNLSDPAAEEALYDSLAMRGFVGIDLGREPVPDETTVCRFRHDHRRQVAPPGAHDDTL
jgi:IS5 family transposase